MQTAQGLHRGEIGAFAGQTRLADLGLCQIRANRPSKSLEKPGLSAKIETQTVRAAHSLGPPVGPSENQSIPPPHAADFTWPNLPGRAGAVNRGCNIGTPASCKSGAIEVREAER